ncbi:unnamed protein product [Caenorhabditis nigoni]
MITEGVSIKWSMGLETVLDPEGDRIRVFIKNQCSRNNARISFFVLIGFWNQCRSRGKHIKEANGKVFTRNRIKISEIVKNQFFWLDSGALQIEYGIHLEAYHLDDGIWNFNFRDKIFNDRNGLSLKVIIQPETDRERELHCHKAQLQFHSQYLSSKFSIADPILSDQVLPLNCDFDEDYTQIVLQIAHGVCMPLSVYYCRRLIRVAEKLKLRTVSRYIERQMIEYEDDWDYSMYHVGFRDASFLKAAIKYDLNHFLAHILTMNKPMKDVYEDEDVQHMSRNTMMLILAKFMEISF